MVDFASPEYAKLIEEVQRRNELQRKQAEAGAQGEAQRRGLVGQTGTSDIEMSLRGARTAPIVEAGQGQVAGLLKEMSDQRLQDQRTQQAQQYGTSERLGSQQYQTGENVAQRGWQTGEREAGQGWQTGENTAQRGWQTGEREGGQRFESNMAGYTDPNTGAWVQTGTAPGQYGQRGENLQAQSYDEMMANRQRQWQREDEDRAKKQAKKGRWGNIGMSFLNPLASAVGTRVGNYGSK